MGFIYWIASYPKSGNTWTRAVLTSLITGGLKGQLDSLRQIIPDENSGPFYAPHLRKPIQEASNAELARVRPLAHRAMAKQTPNFLLLKTHSMVANHHGTATITPDVTAGAVYLLRNPLDVAVSYSDFRERDVDKTIALMNQSGRELDRPRLGAYEMAGSWSENVGSWTKPHDRVVITRYEDLLDAPEEHFGRIVRFLKMDVTDAQIAAAVEESSFENLKAVEERAGFAERPPQAKAFFRSGRAGEWRDRLSEAQVAKIVTANHELMKRFGYWLDEFGDLVRNSASAQ